MRGRALNVKGTSADITNLDELRDRATKFGEQLFAMAGLGPADVDVVNVYDGFSIFVPLWLETLGFCKEGEAFDFMTDDVIAIDGKLPLNMGGNLGSGRMHGVPHSWTRCSKSWGAPGRVRSTTLRSPWSPRAGSPEAPAAPSSAPNRNRSSHDRNCTEMTDKTLDERPPGRHRYPTVAAPGTGRQPARDDWKSSAVRPAGPITTRR